MATRDSGITVAVDAGHGRVGAGYSVSMSSSLRVYMIHGGLAATW